MLHRDKWVCGGRAVINYILWWKSPHLAAAFSICCMENFKHLHQSRIMQSAGQSRSSCLTTLLEQALCGGRQNTNLELNCVGLCQTRPLDHLNLKADPTGPYEKLVLYAVGACCRIGCFEGKRLFPECPSEVAGNSSSEQILLSDISGELGRLAAEQL